MLKYYLCAAIMSRRPLLDNRLLDITISRLAQQLVEHHYPFTDSVILGMQPRGIYFASRIAHKLEAILNKPVPLGKLDVTFFRDDFRRREKPIKANETDIPFALEDKRVILADDVLYTGRTVRSALDAMIAHGRPANVELLILIDRLYSRDLPIQPTYVGKHVNTMDSQRVLVEWTEQGAEMDKIWLVNKEEA